MSKKIFGFVGAKNKSVLTRVGSMCLALCLVSAPAYADIIGGHWGHGWPNAVVGCFQGSWSRMFNIGGENCDPLFPQTLVIPLYVRSTGNTTITVRASGNGLVNNPTTCTGIRNDGNNSGFFTASMSTTSSSLVSLALGRLGLTAGNTLSVECSVFRNGSVQNVSWTQ